MTSHIFSNSPNRCAQGMWQLPAKARMLTSEHPAISKSEPLISQPEMQRSVANNSIARKSWCPQRFCESKFLSRGVNMALWRPDPSFHPSPRLAGQAPAEKLAFVALLSPKHNGLHDALGVVDVDPASSSYGKLV